MKCWLLSISLLLVSVETGVANESQIDSYFRNIETNTAVSESVWALLALARENDTLKQSVLENGRERNQGWVEYLAETDETLEAIHLISKALQNEYLQLFLQLLRLEPEEKVFYYNDFYTSAESSRFQELNRLLAYSEEINFDDVITEDWDFSYFLIAVYNLYISFDTTQDQFYSRLSSRLNEFEQSVHNDHQIHQNFYHAARLNSLYNGQLYSEIAENYEHFIELALIPDTQSKRNLYWRLEFAVYRAGQIDRSLFLQRQYIIPLSEQLNDKASLNAVIADHGANLYLIGKFEEARVLLQTALTDTNNLDNSIRTRLLNNLGLAHYKLGETNEYLETQFRSLEFAQDQENYSFLLNIYRNLHIYFRETRNWELALDHITEARRIAEEIEDDSELANIIISLAVFYQDYLSDYDMALQYLDEAEKLIAENPDFWLNTNRLYEQADLLRNMERFEESREIYQEVAQIGLENNNNYVYLIALADLADVEFELGNYQSSREYIREFNLHDITIVDFYMLVQARNIEAGLAIQEGRFQQAETILHDVSRQVLRWAHNTADPEGGYWHIEESYLELFETYSNFLISQGRIEQAVAVLDQFKTINDASLFDNPLLNSKALSEEELTELHTIKGRIDQLRKRILVGNENQKLDIQNQISALTARKNQLTVQDGQDYGSKNIKLWAIQSRLKPNQVILHVTRILDQFYQVQISSKELNINKLEINESVEATFEHAIESLATGHTDLRALYEIYNYLELNELPYGTRSLIVIPDSYLYQLPLDILPTVQPAHSASYGSARYLIEEFEVSYLNNLQEFMTSSPKPAYELDYAGFGISRFQTQNGEQELVPLPNATYEVEEITRQLNRFGPTRTFTESEASPYSFITNAPRSQILHLATHSTISEDDPLFSRLYLASSQRSSTNNESLSGQLFAYELFDLDLQNDLIMLNSCESGSGRYFQGSGIMGISRALRYAGARSLILNSWSVNDQFASDFAIEFYRHINLGKSKSKSLREAKLYFLRNKNANPHYWGPYMLNGETNAMISKPGMNHAYLFLFVIVIGGVWFTHKKSSIRISA